VKINQSPIFKKKNKISPLAAESLAARSIWLSFVRNQVSFCSAISSELFFAWLFSPAFLVRVEEHEDEPQEQPFFTMKTR
jgi:hypothetical protein